jgi:hypothetical protein
MKKLFLFLPIFLLAKIVDFTPCYKKYSYIKNLVPITYTRSVTFTKPKEYLYYDPFTGMYVVKAKNKKIVRFSYNPKLGWWMAGIKKNAVYAGTYASKMIFFYPAHLSVFAPRNSVITDLFCRAYGIENNGGLIEGDYINHFVKYGYFGDIGLYVDEKMVIKYFDPFYVSGVKRGDKILKINGKKANVDTYKKYVLFGKIGNYVYVKTNRKSLKIKVRKRVYNFTPLLRFGIVINKHLDVIRLPKWIEERTFIYPPAKLVAINGLEVSSFEQVRKIDTKHVTITLEKDGIRITVELKDGMHSPY